MRRVLCSLVALVGLLSLVSCWEERIAIDEIKAKLSFELSRDDAGKVIYGDTLHRIAIGDTFTLFAKCEYPQAIKSFEVLLIDSVLGDTSKLTKVKVTDTTLLPKITLPSYVGSFVIPKSGRFTVEVTVISLYDSLLSTKDTLKVLAGAKPKLTTHKEISIPKKEIRVGDTTALVVHLDSGATPVIYRWFKDNKIVTSVQDSTLKITTASRFDAGIYHCEIENPWGKATTEPCTLSVKRNSAPIWSSAIPAFTVQELQPLTIDFSKLCSDSDGDTLTFKTILGATVPLKIDGTIGTYTPNHEESGTYQLTLIATDGRESVSKTITVTVTNLNRLPYWDTTGTYTMSVSENKVGAIDLKKLGKDLDAGDKLTFAIVSSSLGSASIKNDSLILSPTLSESGKHTVTISVADSAGVAVSHDFAITVLNTNQAPVWKSSFTVIPAIKEGMPFELNLTPHASDPDTADKLTFGLESTTLNGVDGSPLLSVTPAGQMTIFADFDKINFGTAHQLTFSVTLTVSDSLLNQKVTLPITIINQNRLPFWDTNGIYSLSLSENKASSFDLKKLAIDLDTGDKLTFAVVASSLGSASIKNDSLILTPTLSESGKHTVKISVADSSGVAVSHEFAVTVSNTNQAPIWDSASIVIPAIKEGTPFTCNLSKFASDKDTNKLRFALESTTLKKADGTQLLTIDSSGNLTGFVDFGNLSFGTATQLSFTLIATVSDSFATSRVTLPITVIHQNRAPIWTLSSSPYIIAAIKESETLKFNFRSLVKDPDGSALKFSFLKEIPGITIVGDSTIQFTPDYGVNNATFTFTLIASDGIDTASAPFQFDVRDKNRVPFWVADSVLPIAIDENSTKLIDLTKRTTDLDGDIKTFGAKSALPDWITLKDGILTLAPGFKNSGQTVIILTVSDGTETVSQEFVVNVKNVNQKPVFVADKPKDKYVIVEGTPLDIDFTAMDPDSEPLKIEFVSASLPRKSSIKFSEVQGKILWNSLLGDYSDTNSITLKVSDSSGGFTLKEIKIAITKDNVKPSFTIASATIGSKNVEPVITKNTFNLEIPESQQIRVKYQLTDPNKDIVSIKKVSATNSTISFNPVDSTIIYLPNDSVSWHAKNNHESIVFEISDGSIADTVTLDFTVFNVNKEPVLTNDTSVVAERATVLVDVFKNDKINDYRDTLLIKSVGISSPGGVTPVISGNYISYTAPNGFSGPDKFSFTVQDLDGVIKTCTTLVVVDAVNDAPTAKDDAFTINEDVETVFDVLANDKDPENNPLTLTLLSSTTKSGGIIKLNAEKNKIVYTPVVDFFGVDEFTYRIHDGQYDATAKVTLTVLPVNDLPIFTVTPSNGTAYVENEYVGKIAFKDTDSKSVTISSIKTTPVGLVDFKFNEADGTIRAIPSREKVFAGNSIKKADSIIVEVTATDADGGTNVCKWGLTIAAHKWDSVATCPGAFSIAANSKNRFFVNYEGAGFNVQEYVDGKSIASYVQPKIKPRQRIKNYGDAIFIEGEKSGAQYWMEFDVSQSGVIALTAPYYQGNGALEIAYVREKKQLFKWLRADAFAGSDSMYYIVDYDFGSDVKTLKSANLVCNSMEATKNGVTVFLCAENGSIYRKMNEKAAWLKVNSDEYLSVVPVSGDGTETYFINRNGNVCLTTNGRNSSIIIKDVQNSALTNVVSLSPIDSRLGWALDKSGNLHFTKGGFSESSPETFFNDIGRIKQVAVSDLDKSVYVLTESNVIYKY